MIGAAAFFVISAALVVGALVPATRGLFADGRVAGITGWAVVYRAVVRIPLGTVVLEEVAFRGVLLGVLSRVSSAGAAVVWSSVVFGLWHIVPTLATARANDIVGLGRLGLVLGSVVVTAVGGAVFCALRLRGRHVGAPALLHLGFNDAGYLLAWWVRA